MYNVSYGMKSQPCRLVKETLRGGTKTKYSDEV